MGKHCSRCSTYIFSIHSLSFDLLLVPDMEEEEEEEEEERKEREEMGKGRKGGEEKEKN